MTSARVSLAFAAVPLLVVSGLHVSAAGEVRTWLEGGRGAILQALWYVPAIDWVSVSLLWLYAAWRPDRHLAAMASFSSILPAAAALLLLSNVGGAFTPGWLLLGTAIVAGLSGYKLAVRLGTERLRQA
jgi:hypothetical protein